MKLESLKEFSTYSINLIQEMLYGKSTLFVVGETNGGTYKSFNFDKDVIMNTFDISISKNLLNHLISDFTILTPDNNRYKSPSIYEYLELNPEIDFFALQVRFSDEELIELFLCTQIKKHFGDLCIGIRVNKFYEMYKDGITCE